NNLRELLALPHVSARNGVAYARICYRTSGGKWRTKSRRVQTVEEAIAAVAEIQRELGVRGPSAFEGQRMTFDELLRTFLKHNPKMTKGYEQPITEYFANRRLSTLTHTDLKRFRLAREAVKAKGTEETRKPATINREMEWLRVVILYAVRRKWIPNNLFNEG